MIYIQPTCFFFFLYSTQGHRVGAIKVYYYYSRPISMLTPKHKGLIQAKQMYKSYCLSNTKVLSKQNKCIKVTVWSTVLDTHHCHWYIFEKVWIWGLTEQGHFLFFQVRNFSQQPWMRIMFWPTSVLKLKESFTVLGSQHREPCVPTVLNEPMVGQSNADYYTDSLFMGGKNSWQHYQHFIVVCKLYNYVSGKHSNTYLHVDPHLQC